MKEICTSHWTVTPMPSKEDYQPCPTLNPEDNREVEKVSRYRCSSLTSIRSILRWGRRSSRKPAWYGRGCDTQKSELRISERLSEKCVLFLYYSESWANHLSSEWKMSFGINTDMVELLLSYFQSLSLYRGSHDNYITREILIVTSMS